MNYSHSSSQSSLFRVGIALAATSFSLYLFSIVFQRKRLKSHEPKAKHNQSSSHDSHTHTGTSRIDTHEIISRLFHYPDPAVSSEIYPSGSHAAATQPASASAREKEEAERAEDEEGFFETANSQDDLAQIKNQFDAEYHRMEMNHYQYPSPERPPTSQNTGTMIHVSSFDKNLELRASVVSNANDDEEYLSAPPSPKTVPNQLYIDTKNSVPSFGTSPGRVTSSEIPPATPLNYCDTDDQLTPNSNETRRYEYLSSLINQLGTLDNLILVIDSVNSLITAIRNPSLAEKNIETLMQLELPVKLAMVYATAASWADNIILKSCLRLTEVLIESKYASAYVQRILYPQAEYDIMNCVMQQLYNENEYLQQDALRLLRKVTLLRDKKLVLRIVDLDGISILLQLLGDYTSMLTTDKTAIPGVKQSVIDSLRCLEAIVIADEPSDQNIKLMLMCNLDQILEELKSSCAMTADDLDREIVVHIQRIADHYFIH
jgi:hypothetical protein